MMKCVVSPVAAFCIVVLACTTVWANDNQSRGEGRLGESRHLSLQTLVVSVFDDRRARGLLSVDVGLNISQTRDRSEIEQIMPRLRDSYISALTSLARNRFEVDRPVDLDVLHTVLQSATDRTLGAERARVLITGASVRRL